MEYFFYVDKNLPEGVGISLYGKEHIAWLLSAAAACLLLGLLAGRLSGRRVKKLEWVMCGLIFASELLRMGMLLSAGYSIPEVLPLHMCGLSIFIVLWHVASGSKLAAELMYCLGMPGALCALLFPNWTHYPALNLLSINSVFVHILLAAYPIVLLSSGELRPNPRLLPKCFACLAGAAVPVYVFDKLTGMNYFFLNWPSVESPLELFARYLGNPGYILGFFPLIGIVWLLLYIPVILYRRLRKN